MARIPSEKEVRSLLEGYGVDCTVLTKAWIDAAISEEVVPRVEAFCRLRLGEITTYDEFYDGNGEDTLMLSRRNVTQLLNIVYVGGADYPISVSSVTLIGKEGILKARTNIYQGNESRIFSRGNRNIRVQYTVDLTEIPNDLARAVTLLAANLALEIIADRTGGGSLAVQSHSRDYGARGKYHNLRTSLVRRANGIMKRYFTGVTQ